MELVLRAILQSQLLYRLIPESRLAHSRNTI